MLFWFILFPYGINANQVIIEFLLQTISVIIQKTIPMSELVRIDYSQLCLDVDSSCTIAVYNDINQTCLMYIMQQLAFKEHHHVVQHLLTVKLKNISYCQLYYHGNILLQKQKF